MAHYAMNKTNAKKMAMHYRKKGYVCTIYKKKNGMWGVSVKRK